MKTLFLIRHGHAETKSDVPDEARNLDDLGRKQVEHIAELMLKQGLRPDLILSSHANRAFQTAEIIAQKLAYPVKSIQIEKDIYYTDEDTLLDVITSQDDASQSILLAGHNPTISRLANHLSKEIKDSMVNAGLLIVECTSNSWSEIRSNTIKHLGYFEPQVRVPGQRAG
jgi:phosphohistidine phosphatase